MSDPAASIRGVSFNYDEFQALQNVNFDVDSASFFGLLGPNGSGKTTLFRILSTLMPPASGSCSVHGFDTITHPNEVRSALGMIFQQPSLDEELTVRENLTFHGHMYGLRGKELQSRISSLANRIGISDRLEDRVKKLSGGLKRRADIIRGILHRPRLLLLDEPTTALDPAARHSFWQLLSGLRQEEGLTLILATHLLEEAEPCDDVVILDHGKVAIQGNPTQLRESLGRQMLWLTTASPEKLSDLIQQKMEVETQVLNDAVCIVDEKATSALPALYESFGDLIDSATIRKPTLEDVFLTSTGNQYISVEDASQAQEAAISSDGLPQQSTSQAA